MLLYLFQMIKSHKVTHNEPSSQLWGYPNRIRGGELSRALSLAEHVDPDCDGVVLPKECPRGGVTDWMFVSPQRLTLKS